MPDINCLFWSLDTLGSSSQTNSTLNNKQLKMSRLTLVLVALAAFLIQAQCEEIVVSSRTLKNVDPVEFGAVKGIPRTIYSNLPTSLNNVALSYAEEVLTHAPNLIIAAQQLKSMLQNYNGTQQWSVAIEPAAYYVTSYYFAHYLVETYNVFLYTANCGHL